MAAKGDIRGGSGGGVQAVHAYLVDRVRASSSRLRVRLEADPIGKTLVEGASIDVDGQTVASGRGKKPGHSVRLSAWVGAD